MTRLAVVLLGSAGCFGAGPIPEAPAGADLIAYVRPSVNDSGECTSTQLLEPYLGDVAIGGDGTLLVALNQWHPPNNCGPGGGGDVQTYTVPVYVIPLDGDVALDLSKQPIEHNAGTAHGPLSARVGASRNPIDTIHAWVWNSDLGGGIEFDGVPALSLSIGLGGVGGVSLPTGFVVGSAFGFLAVTSSQGSNNDVFNPSFPSQPSGTSGIASASAAWRISWADQTPEPITLGTEGGTVDAVYAETVKSGLVANGSNLFYAARRDTTQPIVIKSLDKASLDGVMTRATIPHADGVLVGMDATDDYLVWSVAPSYAQSVPPPSCVIKKLDLVNGGETVLLSTTRFACLDAELDGAHVYFTIFEADNNDNDGSSGAYGVRGVGLGRVSIDGGEPETVRHGINSNFRGPRRVYLYGDDLYAVDSFSIARIAKSGLDNKHDF